MPQLKTITLGGAVTGLGIESSSFRNGLPHESVLEMEVLTGDGRLVLARPDNEHRALFHGFPNSYGTLGYALRLTIELEPVRPFVRLRHVPFTDRAACFAAMEEVCGAGEYDGESVDFLDGTVFGPGELYLTLGTFVDVAPTTSDYTGMEIYYRSHSAPPRRPPDHPRLPVAVGHGLVLVLARLRRAGPARPPAGTEALAAVRHLLEAGRHRAAPRPAAPARPATRRPPWEDVVQDIEVPIERAAEFLDFFTREVPISPLWLCPLRQRDPAATWDLYALDPESTYVNFGFWSTVPVNEGEPVGACNRRIERVVEELGGRKSLYSTSFYEREEFWRLYNGPAYAELKAAYDGEHRLLDLYEKCVERG